MHQQWNVYESFQALLKAGTYHLALEGVLIVWIIWLLTKKPKSKNVIKLSKKEEEQLLSEWTPEPLISNPLDPSHPSLKARVIDGKVGLHVTIGEKKALNLASHNYLNLSERPEIEQSALECLNVYGVGSCGPRGFYGTTVVHIKLEDRVAEFYGMESALIYSYGFSTIASAIPAYSKSGDIIFADEFVNFAIQRGMEASRSKLIYYRHNDMEHLEQLLEEQQKLDKKNPKKAAATRQFLLAEGIYANSGDICPLPELIRIRAKYKLRLFLDESIAFGSMGTHARGTLDHFNIPVIDILEEEGNSLVIALQEVCRKLHKAFSALSDKVVLRGSEISPLKHIFLKEHLPNREDEENLLREVVNQAEEEGLAIVMSAHRTTMTYKPPPPSIRIAVNKDLTDEDIAFSAQVLARALNQTLANHDDAFSPIPGKSE